MEIVVQPEKRIKIFPCINCGEYPELIETEYACHLECKCGCKTKSYGGWCKYTDRINSYQAREMAINEWNEQNNLIASCEVEPKLVRKIYYNKVGTFTADNSKFNSNILRNRCLNDCTN